MWTEPRHRMLLVKKNILNLVVFADLQISKSPIGPTKKSGEAL